MTHTKESLLKLADRHAAEVSVKHPSLPKSRAALSAALDDAFKPLSDMTTHTVNQSEATAVATETYLQDMDTCPRGVKVQLMNPGGVLVYSTWDGKDTCWQAWAPLPRRRKEL
jgi:hypothetical protein